MSLRQLLVYGGDLPSSATFFDWYCRYGCGPQSVVFPYYDRPMFGSGAPLVKLPVETQMNNVMSVEQPELYYDEEPEMTEMQMYSALNTFLERNPNFGWQVMIPPTTTEEPTTTEQD